MTEKLQQPIIDFQLQLAVEEPYGYVRAWQVHTRIPPENIRPMHFNGLR